MTNLCHVYTVEPLTVDEKKEFSRGKKGKNQFSWGKNE